MPADEKLASELRIALRPLLRKLIRERTLSLGKSGILNQLTQRGPSTASELSAAGGISPQAIAVALRELEDLSLVARIRDDTDRRRVRVEITPQGVVALENDRATGTAWFREAVSSRLDDGERAALEAFIPILRKLTADDINE